LAVRRRSVAGGDLVSRAVFSSEAFGGGVGRWWWGVTGLVVQAIATVLWCW
jgi:hypothetical protein